MNRGHVISLPFCVHIPILGQVMRALSKVKVKVKVNRSFLTPVNNKSHNWKTKSDTI